jgi:hypothetical protein
LHVGTIIAGIIGEKKFSYDLWGDIASRMEGHGESDVKGKGIMPVYFINDPLNNILE